MTASPAAHRPRAAGSSAPACSSSSACSCRRQHPLDLRQAGGARPGPVQGDLAGADREPGDPGADRGRRWSMPSTRTSTSRASSKAKLPTNLQALAEPDRRALAQGFVGTAAEKLARPAARPGRVRRARPCSRRSSSSRSCTVTRGRRDVERQRRPRPPAARPQARRQLRVRQQSRGQDPAGLGAGHDPRGRRPRDGPERHPLARADRELHLDPRRRLLGRRDLARPRPPPAGGPRARDRPRRRRRPRAPRAVGSPASYFVDQHRRQRFGAAGRDDAWQIITQSLAAAGWVALVGRHPRRGRAPGSSAPATAPPRPGCARSRTYGGGRSPGARSSS